MNNLAHSCLSSLGLLLSHRIFCSPAFFHHTGFHWVCADSFVLARERGGLCLYYGSPWMCFGFFEWKIGHILGCRLLEIRRHEALLLYRLWFGVKERKLLPKLRLMNFQPILFKLMDGYSSNYLEHLSTISLQINMKLRTQNALCSSCNKDNWFDRIQNPQSSLWCRPCLSKKSILNYFSINIQWRLKYDSFH